MAEPPVIFKRTKSKPSQRARATTSEVDTAPTTGTEADGEADESPSAVAAKLKKKTRAKARSTLSFGGDEEEGGGEVFKLKKSNLSRNIALRNASPGISPAPFEPTIAPRSTGPTYDAAYLNELKASTPTARPSVPQDETISYDADISMDVDPSAHVSTLTGLAGEHDVGLAYSVSDPVDIDPGDEAAIPSASSILAAKQKRERLRASKASGQEDYISLSLTKRDDYSKGPHPNSRLVREEDELGEADDEFAEYTSAQERIALGKKSRKKEAQKRREEMNEMIVDAEEEDEETREWEQEQLRRGGLRPEAAEPAPKPVYKPAPIPSVTPIPTMGAAMARLTQSMSELTMSHAEHSAAMSKLGEEQRLLEQREKEMREMITKAEEKRSWFSAFREWVESVATFLDEKFPQLEKLEDEHISIIKERADMIAQRRKAEDEDDLTLFLGLPPQLQPGPDEVDDLGRIVPSANSAASRADRTAARAARRLRRRAANQQKAAAEEEGYSTDASLPPADADDYRAAMGKLVADAQAIMADVKAEEFRDPRAGLGKWFGEWRAKFGDVYRGAWGGLGMVSAWEFWARLEILGWNPLERPRSLDTFNWYKALYAYSRPAPADEDGEDEDEEPELGPDGDLVSAMISTALIPRLCRIVESGALDAYSAADVRRLIDLTEQVEASVDRQSLKFELLLKSVHTAFSNAVAATETLLEPFLALNQPRFDPAAIPARRRFLARRHKLLQNLLQWRRYAGDRYGVGALATRLVAQSMLPVAETGWEVGGEEIMRRVAQGLPTELVPPALQGLLRSS
ncbi:nineteen complex-related protein 2-domain-containing protein [Trametes polyzona]|nr:nineteen complex-related protein 2-domain-containing protein [Trametes polyzona]